MYFEMELQHGHGHGYGHDHIMWNTFSTVINVHTSGILIEEIIRETGY